MCQNAHWGHDILLFPRIKTLKDKSQALINE